MYGLIRPWARYVRLLIFGALLIWTWVTYNFSTSKLLKSALASALLNRCNKYSADFAGQRPCVHLWFLHWAFLPTPPLKRLNGTISFLAITFLRNCCALLSDKPLMALAVSRVFYCGMIIEQAQNGLSRTKLVRKLFQLYYKLLDKFSWNLPWNEHGY